MWQSHAKEHATRIHVMGSLAWVCLQTNNGNCAARTIALAACACACHAVVVSMAKPWMWRQCCLWQCSMHTVKA